MNLEHCTDESFRDTLYTVDQEGRRKWVYPNSVPGRFLKRRAVTAYLLMAVYLCGPWIFVGGKQAILFDIPNRKFRIAGIELWATDMVYLWFGFALLGIALFLFTSLWGRIWCGWACPETVFLEFLFRPLERLIEGNASERRRLDSQPWSAAKFGKKLIKHGLCAAFSSLIALTFIAYFTGSGGLLTLVSAPFENPAAICVILFIMAAMAFQFGWFREQFCTIVCPYARFQSVLMDSDSLTIGYDRNRGEPRGKLSSAREGGDCIDCRLCVRVCPTGIDIRNGSQLECVACAQCIDACDSIMYKIGKPRGLIRYDTERGFAGAKRIRFRPRVVIYAGFFALNVFFLGYLLDARQLSEVQILRPVSDAPYMLLPAGRLSNRFEVRISNKNETTQYYSLSLPGSPGAYETMMPLNPYPVGPGEIVTVPLFINLPLEDYQAGKRSLEIALQSGKDFHALHQVTLLGPDL